MSLGQKTDCQIKSVLPLMLTVRYWLCVVLRLAARKLGQNTTTATELVFLS